MNAHELITTCQREHEHFQLYINEFVDEFRRSEHAVRAGMVNAAPTTVGPFEGLVAAVVSALCREVAMATPPWIASTASPDPFFVIPAQSFALRLRLMLESPPPFRARNVFVPETYMSRA
jgi:hypothetical protein